MVCQVLICFFIILGIVDLINTSIYIIFGIHKNKNKNKKIKIFLTGHQEDIEFTIRKTILENKLNKEYKKLEIACINKGADNETLRICRHLANDYQGIVTIK